jgi:hypothetical protein
MIETSEFDENLSNTKSKSQTKREVAKDLPKKVI